MNLQWNKTLLTGKLNASQTTQIQKLAEYERAIKQAHALKIQVNSSVRNSLANNQSVKLSPKQRPKSSFNARFRIASNNPLSTVDQSETNYTRAISAK